VADFHIHSHFSMATSKELNPRSIGRWAGLKGVSLVGTGDFTHPGWRQELKETLIPAEPGFYKLKEAIAPEIPDQPEARFIVSGELSTIYKKNGRVRKVHHLIILPSLEAAGRISDRLADLGMNIRSDGRPILGMDSHDLFSLVLEECPEVIYIPAHVWTPHFSVFGSNSGFDDIYECYEDLTQYIHALETGLSSDPAMNWRWSALDRYTLVSNSDAHNPGNLAREANLFEAEFTYDGIKKALENRDSGGFTGTIEFFPEEGKYHYDGHRNCEIAWKPEDTVANQGLCPVCGRKVTVGVLHRVAALADRPEGFRPEGVKPYQSLIPLAEVIGSAFNMGRNSKKVTNAYHDLLQKLGPELTILRETDIDAIAGIAGPLIAEAVRRLRAGEVEVKPGYDGAYGIVSLLREDDRQALLGQAALFEAKLGTVKRKAAIRQAAAEVMSEAKSLLKVTANDAFHTGLTKEQDEILKSQARIIAVGAGPGTGKTKTLVERIVYLIQEAEVDPAEITAVTFTNRAANEIKSRLAKLLAGDRKLNRLNLGTFHSLVWKILRQDPQSREIKLLDNIGSKSLIEETLREQRIPLRAREASLALTLLKNRYLWEEEPNLPSAAVELYQAYQQNLRRYRRWDFDDLIPKMVDLWEDNPDWLQPFKRGFQHVLVDEFQDLNLIQYQLVKLWAKDCRSLMAIGDPNQSIYGFRGSDSRFFTQLEQDFPETVSYKLTHNFRSGIEVIKAANALIPKTDRQVEPKTARGGSESKIIWYETPSEKAAAQTVVNQIVQLLGGSTMISAHGRKRKGDPGSEDVFSLSEMAILYRTGRQAESLEIALTTAGLPHRVSGSTLTLEASPVKEFLTFFRYLTDPEDLFWLRSALRYPRWNLNGAEATDFIDGLDQNRGKEAKTHLGELITTLPEVTAMKLRQFFGVAEYYREQLKRKSPEVIEDWIIRNDLGLEPEMEQLRRISENYKSIEELLEFLPLAREADLTRKGNKTTGTEMITLSTLHAAKGLEFPVVFIVGVEEGMIPYGDEEEPETIAEEQRLFYVGVTRAEKRLYLVNSQFRLKSGSMVPVVVSRFLRMLPQELLEKVEWTKQSKGKQLELF
jgi:uncharacterized protein (TIGR00375 family)